MSYRRLKHLVGISRISNISRLARRAIGVSYLSTDDFMPNIAKPDADRILGLSKRAYGNEDGPAPVIVLGVMPRSGTNFVRDLISKHPAICADPGRLYEFPLLHAGSAAQAFMDEFIAMFPRNSEVLGRWDALAMLSGAWMRELQLEAGQNHILLKSPHVQNLTLAPLIFPGAKIILCLRDGRDVVDSSLRTFSRWTPARKTFGQLAREWQLGTDAILSFAPDGVNHHPDITIVKYETLVTDPNKELTKLLNHTGLDAKNYPFETLSSMPVRGSSRSKSSEDDRWQPQEKSRDFNPVGRWSGWSTRQVSRFERIAGQTLKVAGYDHAP